MTLKELVMQTSFEEVSPEVRRLFHSYMNPYTLRGKQRFCRAFEKLRDIEPEPNAMILTIVHKDVTGYYDEETWKKMKEEDPSLLINGYGIGLTPWKDVLGMEIDAKTLDRLSPEAIIANCLDEMLFYGSEEERELYTDDIEEEDNIEEEDVSSALVIHRLENGVATIFEGTTRIPEEYFKNATEVKTVIIPLSVTSIGKGAFSGCSSLRRVVISDIASWCKISFDDSWANPLLYARQLYLDDKEITELSIPNDVISIADYAFVSCSFLTSLNMSRSVKIIGNEAFSGCSELTTLKIPNGVKVIGDEAFSGCSNLSFVKVPDSLIAIGDRAFYDCSELTSLSIPESVSAIGVDAFYGCSGLSRISVDEENIRYDSRDNCNAIIETSSNTLILGCKSTIVPHSITSIGNHAFAECSGLLSIIIPNDVISLGKQTFLNCENLRSVLLPNSLTVLKDGLFTGCSKLASVVIPESVKLIERDVFQRCSSLVAVHIPHNVEEIMSGQFGGCDSMISLTVDSENPFYDSREGCNAIIETKTNILISGCNKSVIPDTVVEIFDYAFDDCSVMNTISIPNSVIRIEDGAFHNCSELSEVEFPESVQYVGCDVFYNCKKLKKIVFKGSSTKLRYGTFDSCEVQSVMVPKGTAGCYKEMLSEEIHDVIMEQN